jgi:hypothetical protein
MNKKYKYQWEESTTRFEKIFENLENWCQVVLDATVNKILNKRVQRKVKVRIDYYDTWSMDHTLAYLIVPMLKQLKNTKQGSPYIDKEDLPQELHLSEREDAVFNHGSYDKTLNATEQEIEAASEKFHAQWKWVIDQMIWSFEQELDEDEGDSNFYDPYSPDEVIKPRKYGILNDDGSVTEKEFPLSEDWIRKHGKFNHEKYKAYHERKQKGFTLFGKYYQSLWD